MNKLSLKDRAKIIHCLVEGNSMRATSRLCDVSINTVTKLLVDVGYGCLFYHQQAVQNLNCKRIECDEIWAFCQMKQKNIPAAHKDEFGYGDVYTYTAIDPDTKLCAAYLVGRRTQEDAYWFMDDLQSRLANRVQLSTDGFKQYIEAVALTFGSHVDFAMLVKHYSASKTQAGAERRYSPADFIRSDKRRISGDPDVNEVSTSMVERQNLTMRMGMRRFTRLTNGFSKKVQNLEFAVALHFMYYNFGRVHKTLRVTPAMEAGLTDHVWTIEEIAQLAG